MSNDQPRVPMGIPSGGQYSAAERGEVGLDLDMDGSFYFPPVFRDGQHIADFWAQCRIPDEALRRARDLYELGFDWTVATVPESNRPRFESQFAARNPRPDGSDTDPVVVEWLEQQSAHADAEVEKYRDILRNRRRPLAPADVRQIVRATAISLSAQEFAQNGDDYEQYRANEKVLRLTFGEMTVSDMTYTYALYPLADQFLRDDYELDIVADLKEKKAAREARVAGKPAGETAGTPGIPLGSPMTAPTAAAPAPAGGSALDPAQLRALMKEVVDESVTKLVYEVGNKQNAFIASRMDDLEGKVAAAGAKVVKDLKGR